MDKKQQYIIRKYVMAESATEALRKAKKMPVHEVYVDNTWLEKSMNNEFFRKEKTSVTGFGKNKLSTLPSGQTD